MIALAGRLNGLGFAAAGLIAFLGGQASAATAKAPQSSAKQASLVADSEPTLAAPGPLRRWLTRPLGIHPELLNHGELSPFVDVGAPFGYRFGLKLGLLDVLTVGVVTQWLDPKLGIRVAPELGLALYRGQNLSLGLRYRYLFHQSPKEVKPEAAKGEQQGQDPKANDAAALPEPAFFRVTHYLAGSLVWSTGYVSAGIEVGAAYRRELDQGQTILDPHLFSMQWRPMTGALLRVGNANWGVVLQAMVPSPELSLRFEWRYSLFGIKKRRDPLSTRLDEVRDRERLLKQRHAERGLSR